MDKLRQTGSISSYISLFNEHVVQVDWNKSSLMARFCGGLKDEILDSIATAQMQPNQLQDWMAMASFIDERLWSQRHTQRPPSFSSTSRDHAGWFQVTSGTSSSVPIELDAIHVTTAMAKTPAKRLEYQWQGRYWRCGQLEHVRAKCPINPSIPLSLAAMGREEEGVGGSKKGKARD